ncbi:MAG: Ig-like domain-containing protein [Dehalococcoidia bacterium]
MKKQDKWLLWLTLVTLPFLFSGVILSFVNASDRIPTVITITPSSSSVEFGSSITLTATLRNSEGDPLSGKTIVWLFTTTEYTFGTNIGNLEPSRGVTDSYGQATTTYTPAIQGEPYGVTIRASFGDFIDFIAMGDDFHEGSYAVCHISVSRAPGTAGDIQDTTGAPLWIWVTLTIFLVGSAGIERRLARK